MGERTGKSTAPTGFIAVDVRLQRGSGVADCLVVGPRWQSTEIRRKQSPRACPGVHTRFDAEDVGAVVRTPVEKHHPASAVATNSSIASGARASSMTANAAPRNPASSPRRARVMTEARADEGSADL